MPVRILELAELPSALIDRFEAGDGLLWTGAGVSRRTTERRGGRDVRVGLPGGWDLQRHLRGWTREPHPNPETLAELAGLYVLQRGRPRLNRLLRAVYGAARATAPAFYDLIAALPSAVRVFVTTNYDPFLERALGYRDPVVVVRDDGLERVTQTRPVVYKPHGDAQQPEGCVIATADYDAWEASTGNLPAQLAALYVQHTVVAIGYRAQDDNFRRLLRAVNVNIALRGGTPHTMYVVIPDADINAFSAYAGAEYDLVLVRATGEEFLEWLIKQLEARRRAREAEALSRLIDPLGVREAQKAVRTVYPPHDSARPAAADVPDTQWLPYAEALERLGAEQVAAGRPVDGLLSVAQASRAYRLGGEPSRADDLHRCVLREAIERRRDVDLAQRLLNTMRPRDRGVGDLPSPSDDDTKMLAALADTWDGVPVAQPGFIADLQSRLLAGPPAGDVEAISYRLERLRAEHAVTAGEFARAAEAFGRAATSAPGDDERSACAIRSAFFAGLQQDASVAGAALDRLRDLPVRSEVEPLRQRAIGWLAAVSGDLDAAGEAFDRAAALAVERLDAVAAAAAYRGSAWVERQRPTISITLDGPGRAAYRLEQTVASASVAPRATVRGILDEAEESLRRKDWRGAWRAAMRARRLAYEDLDPDGAERAEATVADAWLAIIPEAEDEFSLFWAAHFTALARAGVRADAEAWVAPLRTALAALGPTPLRTAILRHLAQDPVGRRARASFLLLLADLAEFIDGSLLSAGVVPAIIAGLQSGWGPNAATDPASAACCLLQATYRQLTPEDAARIAATVAALRSGTPFNRLDDVYLALAQAAAMAPTPPDGGAALAGELLGALDEARRAPQPPHYLAALHVALAAIADRGDASTRARVIAALEREAESGEWSGIAVLAAQGVPVPETLADRYLQAMTARVYALTVDASPNTFGFAPSDFGQLTPYAATSAHREIRDEAISAAIALLGHDGQWGAVRAKWVNFLVRLLSAAPERLSDALPCLLRLARGEFSEPGDMKQLMGNHPFSAIHINLGTGSNLRACALVALGAHWDRLPGPEREKIRALFRDSLVDPEFAVREGAVIGIREAAGRLREDWQQHALVQALRDPQEQIRRLALTGLSSEEE